MTKQQIEKSIKYFRNAIRQKFQNYSGNLNDIPEHIAIMLLQSELERVENKPLTIREIQNSVRKSVYCKELNCWGQIIHYDKGYLHFSTCIRDNEYCSYNIFDNSYPLTLYKYKPQEE